MQLVVVSSSPDFSRYVVSVNEADERDMSRKELFDLIKFIPNGRFREIIAADGRVVKLFAKLLQGDSPTVDWRMHKRN